MEVIVSGRKRTLDDLVEKAIESLLEMGERVTPERVGAYESYKENGRLEREYQGLIHKPYREMDPGDGLLRSMIDVIRYQEKKTGAREWREVARRYEFMAFKFRETARILESPGTYRVVPLDTAREMRETVAECQTCLSGKPEEFFEQWEGDEGTLFARVEDEEGDTIGYFRNYTYQDKKGNIVVGVDTVEANLGRARDPVDSYLVDIGQMVEWKVAVASSSILASIDECDYVLLWKYFDLPYAHLNGKLYKRGVPVEGLYSYSRHHEKKRKKISAMNCFSDWFWERFGRLV